MPALTDMLGREVALEVQPKRIISLVPSQTELLADLGLEERVVGITKFCIHPDRWFRTKERVGGTKQVHLSRVAALKPDLIIANKEENVKEQIDALTAIAPVWVSAISSLDEALMMIEKVGNICDKDQEAGRIAHKIRGAFTRLVAPAKPAGRVAYGIWRNPWMWAGGDTFIHDILRRCGWANVLSSCTRYPEVSLEQLENYQPAHIFLSSEPYPFQAKHLAEVQAIVPDARIYLVDGEMFSWYGSRLLHAAPYLQSLIAETI
jgi:ABC-type Fe3+-hydroxamate transport system substrate-binding protein